MIFIQFFNHQSFLEGHSLIASSHLVLFLLSFPYLGIILGIKKSTQTKNFSPRALNYRLFTFFHISTLPCGKDEKNCRSLSLFTIIFPLFCRRLLFQLLFQKFERLLHRCISVFLPCPMKSALFCDSSST